MAVEVFANQPTATVTSGGTTAPSAGTVETWTAPSWAAFAQATTGSTQYHIYDTAPGKSAELILVENTSGTSATVVRGAGGTTPVAHSAPFTVTQAIVANWLNSAVIALQPAGDATGVLDTAYLNAAIAQLGSQGGVVRVAAGVFYWTCGGTVIDQAGITLQGAGLDATVAYAVGTGTVIRMYATSQYTSGFGGGIKGLTIDGTSAGAGSCGVHAGDIYQLGWDAGVRFFQGSGSKGWWFDNQYFWCEDMYGHIWAQENTSNVVFDNSANVSGLAATSFARTLLDIVLDMKAVGDGVTLLNGAELYDSRIGIYGNCDYGTAQHSVMNITGGPGYSFTATNASPCVFTATGSYFANATYVTLSGGSLPAGFTAGGYYVVNASGATFGLSATAGGAAVNSTSTGSGTVQGPFSRIYASRLDIGVECNATSGGGRIYQPVTINFGTAGSNAIRDCTGIIDFTGSSGFATTINSVGSFDFDGICMGDVNLFRVTGAGMTHFALGTITNGAFITTRYNALAVAVPAGNVTGCILGTNDPGAQGAGAASWANRTFTLVNAGTGSITFAALATSHVATGTACVVPAGTSMTFLWWGNAGVWYPAQVQLPAAGPPFLPSDVGWLAWNYDPALIVNSSTLPSLGGIVLIGVNVRSPVSCTNVITVVSTAGGTLTASENFAGLYNSAGTLIGTSADQTTAWGSAGAGLKTMALAGGPFTLPAGMYWVALVANGTTSPAFGRNVNNVAGLVNGANSAATSRYGGILSGQTSLPGSITPSSITQQGVGFWAALS